jgi:hypothetical protein
MTAVLSMAMSETTMVKDPATNLIWEDTTHTTEEKLTQGEAKAYCESLKIGEVAGWRLPTLQELLSIVDYTRAEPAILKEFSHVNGDKLYWSSTPYVGSQDEFWGVKFEDGSTEGASGNYDRHVRCVRAAQ